MKVLISDKVAEQAVEQLQAVDGIEVHYDPSLGKDREGLLDQLKDAEGIIIRSATKLTPDILAEAPKLRAIVRAGVGVDNIDIPAASRRGIIVMNTPGGNTLSTAEQTVALLLALARNTYPACRSLKEGRWDRKQFMGTQLAGKTIGVAGLGRIGLAVADRATALGMKVIGLDPFISDNRAKRHHITKVADLDALLPEADYITVHVPMTELTRGMLGAEAFAKMKDGVRIINCARGGIVDEDALRDAIASGKVAGAALDVYVSEPPTCTELIAMPQVLCTPHLGASTEEAQLSVALEAADQIADALLHGRIRNAINVPVLDPEEAEALAPYCELARDLGILHTRLLGRSPSELRITYTGEAAKLNTTVVTASVLAGLLETVVEQKLNYINAPCIAEDRGIQVTETLKSTSKSFATHLSVTAIVDGEEHEMAGTLVGLGEPRIVVIDGYRVESLTSGALLIIYAEDKPGLIGNVGRVMGEHNINIAAMTFGRKSAGGEAITVLNLDAPIDDDALEAVHNTPHVRHAVSVTF